MRVVECLSCAALAAVLSGCMLVDAKRQMERIGEACVIAGRVEAREGAKSAVVVLATRNAASAERPWAIVDHFVLERAGRFEFAAIAGSYAVGAFEDANGDLKYQPGESYVAVAFDKPLDCAPGTRITDLALAIPEKVANPFPRELDIARLQARSAEEQLAHTLGNATVVGDVVPMSDPRFELKRGADSLWRPLDFVLETRPGIYFLEPYDERRIPVLFVHGLSGAPQNFASLAERIDRRRFQPWVYYYPSGVRLANVAEHLEQTLAKLRQRYRFERFALVAHSMGGLVSRAFIQRHAQGAAADRLPLFVTLSTPWGGHDAAERGVERSPVVVGVWRDMAPGSDFLRDLFATPLPSPTRHHLVFTFRRDRTSFGESDDQAVTVASQLRAEAQRGAERVYGVDDTHRGVLRNSEVAALVNRLLDGAFAAPR